MTEVVVTGLGLVTPIGIGTGPFWANLLEGASGVAPISTFDASDQQVQIAAEVSDFEASDFMSPRDASRSDRFTQMALAAAELAVDEASLGSVMPAAGVVIGSGIGGLRTIEAEHRAFLASGPRRVSPFMVPMLMPNGAAGAVAMKLGLHGPNFAVASACASGAHAIGEASRIIHSGAAHVMLAGGTEAALTPLALAAFARMGALSTRNDDPQGASRPFDADRDGFVFGEGAAVLVLESRCSAERRGAHIFASLGGYGRTADAYHVTQPDPEGAGAQAAMTEALLDAGLVPEEVDYINAHGTSTPYNDRTETLAIKKVFGEKADDIPVSSTKSQTGHLLGAAGAVEAAVSVLAIDRGVVPATINYSTPDPACDLDYVPGTSRAQPVRTVLSNSFGFGGQNACLIFKAS